MNIETNACDAISARYAQKVSDGLVDVKFLFQNREEATVELACSELESLHVALSNGSATDLDFGDLNWKD